MEFEKYKMNDVVYVNGDYLGCYHWEDGDELLIKEELDMDIPDGFYRAWNKDKDEYGAVLGYQIRKEK